MMEDIFNEAAAIKSPVERAAYLDRACAGDPTLRDRVERLLAAYEKSGSFLSAPPTAIEQAMDTSWPQAHLASIPEAPGSRIGRYKLLQQIGEGGFGVVFMAEQEEPVRRVVALKVIKLGMDTKQVVARFEAERQALAVMDHPNVARVLDGGATETGRPYFVMELVKGAPITEYCDKEKLSIEKRLELFVQVCQAVQHAHQKGLIHRDIKPSNVLVSTQDGHPVAKVIDFGIAKATQARLTEKTLFTEFRQLMGTPEYMSPEQAEGSLDVDTRSDIYSLGVLLYELLTGATPFDSRELRSKAYDEIRRIIREVDPPTPSARLSTMETLPSVAARRSTEPERLGSTVRGELDWIVMKCLEKDRVRRYESSSAVAADVMHYLAQEAVIAAPPSRVYRLRKFVRRNKRSMIAVASVVIALLVGIVGTSLGLLHARRQRALAVAAQVQESAQRTRAEREAAKVDAINHFMSQALQSSDPNAGGRQNMLVSDAMMQAIRQLDGGQFKDQPEIEAALRLTIAEILDGNAHPSEALSISQRALQLYRQVHSNGDSADTALALRMVAVCLESLGQSEEALTHHEEALAMRRRLVSGDDQQLVNDLNGVAYCRESLGRFADALPLYEEALAMARRLFKSDSEDLAVVENNIGSCLESLGRPDDALIHFQSALEMRQRLYPGDHPVVATSLNNVAHCLDLLGHSAEALPKFQSALEMRRRLFKGDHPLVANSLCNLGYCLEKLGEPNKALPIDQEALEMRRRLFAGKDHPDIVNSLNDLGVCLTALGRDAEALTAHQEALAMSRRLYSADHPDVASSLSHVAYCLDAMGRSAEALPLFQGCLAMNRRLYKGDHTAIASAINCVAGCLCSLDRDAEALPLYQEALEMRRRLFKGDHPELALSLNDTASCLRALGHLDDARTLYEEAVKMRRRLSDHPAMAASLVSLATVLRLQGKLAEAELASREAVESWRGFPADPLQIVPSLNSLALILRFEHKPTEADRLVREALEIRRHALPAGDRDIADSLNFLGLILMDEKKFPESEHVLLEAHQMFTNVKDLPVGRLDTCTRALVAMYKAWDESESGHGHDAQARQWESKLPATVPATTQ
jgi:serine/threonine protein kinase/tetratricopeptide (TPR) repeat protein